MIVIPMAGLSSRFFNAGYNLPKYQLNLGNETIFSWSIKSFEKYFATDKFIFIYRNIFNTKYFLLEEIKNLGIKNYELVCLENETNGQAETVFLGLSHFYHDEELYIFNIDSKILDFEKPSWLNQCDGYLQVFIGEGEHWSFILPNENNKRVLKTTEKYRISNFCSNGLYYFKSLKNYKEVFSLMVNNQNTLVQEYYIAPMYNYLIEKNQIIYYDLIDKSQVLFCGIPDEYQALLRDEVNEKTNS